MTTPTGEVFDTLVHEARSLVARIDNALFCRKHHPSYGFTKADMRKSYYQLQGILYSVSVLVSGQADANLEERARMTGLTYDIDTRALYAKIELS